MFQSLDFASDFNTKTAYFRATAMFGKDFNAPTRLVSRMQRHSPYQC